MSRRSFFDIVSHTKNPALSAVPPYETVVSEGMGHDSKATVRIYPTSWDNMTAEKGELLDIEGFMKWNDCFRNVILLVRESN